MAHVKIEKWHWLMCEPALPFNLEPWRCRSMGKKGIKLMNETQIRNLVKINGINKHKIGIHILLVKSFANARFRTQLFELYARQFK